MNYYSTTNPAKAECPDDLFANKDDEVQPEKKEVETEDAK